MGPRLLLGALVASNPACVPPSPDSGGAIVASATAEEDGVPIADAADLLDALLDLEPGTDVTVDFGVRGC